MKKKHMPILLIILALILIGSLVIIQNSKDQACIEDDVCFKIEISETTEEHAQGLSNQISLDEDEAMFFIFEEKGIPGFWMKDMNFPLDIIWIKEDMKISSISKSLEPCENLEECIVFYPEEEIKYVLEINAGLSEIYGFERGGAIFLK